MSTWDGPCPYVSCVEQGPHHHPVCATCGADNHGNASCATCVRARDPRSSLLPILEARDRRLGRSGHSSPIHLTAKDDR